MVDVVVNLVELQEAMDTGGQIFLSQAIFNAFSLIKDVVHLILCRGGVLCSAEQRVAIKL